MSVYCNSSLFQNGLFIHILLLNCKVTQYYKKYVPRECEAFQEDQLTFVYNYVLFLIYVSICFSLMFFRMEYQRECQKSFGNALFIQLLNCYYLGLHRASFVSETYFFYLC